MNLMWEKFYWRREKESSRKEREGGRGGKGRKEGRELRRGKIRGISNAFHSHTHI